MLLPSHQGSAQDMICISLVHDAQKLHATHNGTGLRAPTLHRKNDGAHIQSLRHHTCHPSLHAAHVMYAINCVRLNILHSSNPLVHQILMPAACLHELSCTLVKFPRLVHQAHICSVYIRLRFANGILVIGLFFFVPFVAAHSDSCSHAPAVRCAPAAILDPLIPMPSPAAALLSRPIVPQDHKMPISLKSTPGTDSTNFTFWGVDSVLARHECLPRAQKMFQLKTAGAWWAYARRSSMQEG
mmetsp:Transcript_50633/g.74234  ORF Transcript_50633/g.74234 Transcript_50633/m.74234 type:complete len:242 (-) Transcript_50633:686-1411(-)